MCKELTHECVKYVNKFYWCQLTNNEWWRLWKWQVNMSICNKALFVKKKIKPYAATTSVFDLVSATKPCVQLSWIQSRSYKKLSRNLCVPWKLVAVKARMYSRRKWISIRTFDICCPILIKFATRNLQRVLLGVREVYENGHRKGCACLMGVNVIRLCVCLWSPKRFNIVERLGAGVCVLRHWYALCLPARVTKET